MELMSYIKEKDMYMEDTPDRYTSKEYEDWRKKVFERDKFTCQLCGGVGARLNAHHIRTWVRYPDLRFKVWNGITLCEDPCHGKVSGFEVLWEGTFYQKTGGDKKLHRVFCKELTGIKKEQEDGKKMLTKSYGIEESTDVRIQKALAINKARKQGKPIIGYKNYGRVVVKELSLMSVNILKFNDVYNREICIQHVENLSEDIVLNGFNDVKPIELNTDYEILDGQHRFLAVIAAGKDMVPCVVVSFPNKNLEADYFSYINSQGAAKPLRNVDLLKSQKAAGNEYAELIYSLHNQPESPLFKKISGLKGDNLVPVEKYYCISASKVCQLVSSVVFKSNSNLKKDDMYKFGEKTKGLTMEDLLGPISEFTEFFYSCFGSRKDKNIMYQDGVFRALISFWYHLKRLGLLKNKSDLKALIKKFYGYKLPPLSSSYDKINIVSILFHQYNKGRSPQNRVFLGSVLDK
jgi:hypothetical protein